MVLCAALAVTLAIQEEEGKNLLESKLV